ncbi:ABC1 kinase family protein [Calidifontibacter indicus]|uniref:Putative unusual protein kinase regulating ubiquinone biosynthesis (AarF/ABC1/UbiB family) n=1 Tax=Calidifontibacter indicus TaxID=419650 RepID=A0A3D9URQ2_9MICO|nr:AarF/ABC1/UbiB kinase family protein [Calidifontibacter indicus]REF31936.1 putative unusual protein kinase regulating ubiquinone biosynthesis (AarF/ABC1/UbiB family) [Calidifontibacter indicus]
MTEIPRKAVVRTARLASLPLGMGARAAIGLGRRVGGAPAEAVTAKLQEQTAAQLFKVLGELKGGAMKFGQALSVFEAALPEELAAPYRSMLTKLQDSAPAMPKESVRKVLREQLGTGWRSRFQAFDEDPVASASIGQVHRAIWKDGREVAVKIQYPGAAEAMLSDLNQLARVMRVSTSWVPGLDVVPILDELRARMSEETDYRLESVMQEQFVDAYEGVDHFALPGVVYATDLVLVTDWIEGQPLSRIIADGSTEERDLASRRYLEFLLGGPQQAGLLHADPHPGNFRLLDDGRLGVLDFGAVNRLPDGLPPVLGELASLALADDAEGLLELLRDAGFVKSSISIDADRLLDYLGVFIEPLRTEEFEFSREWLRSVFAYINDPRSSQFTVGLRLNLPPEFLLIHRTWLGGIAVLCQIGGTVPAREIFEDNVPGAKFPAL